MSGFIDTQGMIKNPGDIVTIRDFKEYWDSNKYDDPILSQYNTFIDWWKDTKQWFPFAEDDEIMGSSSIYAAEDDEKIDPRLDRADELQDRIEDDFDYVLAGVERLGREGQLDAAIDIMEKIAATLDSAIGIIGESFDTDEDFDEEL